MFILEVDCRRSVLGDDEVKAELVVAVGKEATFPVSNSLLGVNEGMLLLLALFVVELVHGQSQVGFGDRELLVQFVHLLRQPQVIVRLGANHVLLDAFDDLELRLLRAVDFRLVVLITVQPVVNLSYCLD